MNTIISQVWCAGPGTPLFLTETLSLSRTPTQSLWVSHSLSIFLYLSLSLSPSLPLSHSLSPSLSLFLSLYLSISEYPSLLGSCGGISFSLWIISVFLTLTHFVDRLKCLKRKVIFHGYQTEIGSEITLGDSVTYLYHFVFLTFGLCFFHSEFLLSLIVSLSHIHTYTYSESLILFLSLFIFLRLSVSLYQNTSPS